MLLSPAIESAFAGRLLFQESSEAVWLRVEGVIAGNAFSFPLITGEAQRKVEFFVPTVKAGEEFYYGDAMYRTVISTLRVEEETATLWFAALRERSELFPPCNYDIYCLTMCSFYLSCYDQIPELVEIIVGLPWCAGEKQLGDLRVPFRSLGFWLRRATPLEIMPLLRFCLDRVIQCQCEECQKLHDDFLEMRAEIFNCVLPEEGTDPYSDKLAN